MTLMSPVTLYLPSVTGPFILLIVGLCNVSSYFSAFNNLLYTDVSMLLPFLWYVNSDEFEFIFGLTLYPLSGITCTGILYSGSDEWILSSSIPGTKYPSCELGNIFRVSAVSVIFQSAHLTSLVMMTLSVLGFYKFYVPLVLFSTYPTMIVL